FPRARGDQLATQVPGVNSVPTEIEPFGPCWAATQRPAVAVRQKSVAAPAKPTGLITKGEVAAASIDASYFVDSAVREMPVKPVSVVLASGSFLLPGKLSALYDC